MYRKSLQVEELKIQESEKTGEVISNAVSKLNVNLHAQIFAGAGTAGRRGEVEEGGAGEDSPVNQTGKRERKSATVRYTSERAKRLHGQPISIWC